MRRIDLSRFNEAASLAVAVEVLNMGGIVAYPTETFYALGVRFDNEQALERLFWLKGRGSDKAASLIIGSAKGAEALASGIGPLARRLMKAHWPGPLTLVLSAAPGLSPYLVKDDTVALRVPGDSIALRLARAAGFAITATSANPAGQAPASEADTVEGYFSALEDGKGVDLLLDGGGTPGGLASTIVDATRGEPRVIRQGALVIK